MGQMSRLIRWFVILSISAFAIGLLALTGIYFYLSPRLPSAESLEDVQLQVPLRVSTREGALVAEFGEQRRVPLGLEDIPSSMIKAVLAAEDDRFYVHPGVDWQGLTRAVIYLIRTGEKGPGGSTITMQVARNFFLGSEKTYVRKANEILLALKIENEFTKDEILELYFNKIFLGHRAYGVGAAAQVYYGRSIQELTLAQVAMIAGLPKAPSRFNPIVNPARALARRNYVLGRMRELEFVSEEEYQTALAAPVTARIHGLATEVEAPYVAEMVRSAMEAKFGPQAYTAGFRVFTTIHARLQEAANTALRDTLNQYDKRHGYRGPERRMDGELSAEREQEILAQTPSVGGLIPAVVHEVGEQSVVVFTRTFGEVELDWDALSWARPRLDENRRGGEPKTASDILAVGDVVRLKETEEGVWRLAQVPEIEGALVSLDPENGAINALAGGFDFYKSKFNRVTQARRQPGSSFKPFIYSAALEHGYTPATLINDAPVVFDDPGLEAAWRPENYSGKFFGPTRMREALTRSRNLVSIRLLRSIGIDPALEHIQRFGFDGTTLPRDLSLALGSGTVTPLALASGYAVLANGGYLIEPYFIARIEDGDGAVIYEASPLVVCRECEQQELLAVAAAALEEGAATGEQADTALELEAVEDPSANELMERVEDTPAIAPRVISEQNVWLMNSMLRDVVRRGTGRRAMQLGRKDLAGKTGTTNDQRDAWFSGFNPAAVTTAWTGFDRLQPLGRKETGARAALPMWIEYMRVALEGVPETYLEQPAGLVTVRIDPVTGLRASAADPNAIFETFRRDQVPKEIIELEAASGPTRGTTTTTDGVTENLF